MQVKEAIVLAGGLGTRLRDAVPDLPKCMAPVNGKPFISFVIKYLQQQGIERFIFSLGYRSDAFTDFLANILPENTYEIVVEEEPLGTGGAIQFACAKTKTENIVVVNGDSIFKTDLLQQAAFHHKHKADCTLALKPMKQFDRYGSVVLNNDASIALFKEKQFCEEGLINGGVYLLHVPRFVEKGLPGKFSFETDYLQRFYKDGKIFGMIHDGYFIDIGIPEDYEKAQKELTD